jgi:aspartyl protease family protein
MLSAALLAAIALRADTIELRNGSRLEGVVIRETPTEIVLQLGTGSTTLRRSSVASIVRADAEDNRAMAAGWRQKYAVKPPPDLTPEVTALGAECAKLGELRTAAQAARQALDGVPAREAASRTELEELRARIVQVGLQIQQAQQAQKTPSGPADAQARRNSVLAYNALISSNTILQVRWEQLKEALAACRKESETAAVQITEYRDAVQLFGARLEAERKRPFSGKGAEDRRQYLEGLANSLAGNLRDFAPSVVPVTPLRGGSVVAALINGEHPARFLVDTGASQVMITDDFVRRMQVDPATLPEAEFTMADGHKAKGHFLTLRTLAVGGAHAENIEAGVLPDKAVDGTDGLLGMSFLRHFSVHLDGASGKLTLWQFQPK